jgi:hypothetical protein
MDACLIPKKMQVLRSDLAMQDFFSQDQWSCHWLKCLHWSCYFWKPSPCWESCLMNAHWVLCMSNHNPARL